METYIQEVVDTFLFPGNFSRGSVEEGSPTIQQGNVWRTYSIFEAGTGKRRSADVVLDLTHENLELRDLANVGEILFDGDLTIPPSSKIPWQGDPRARCIRFKERGWFNFEEIQCVKEGGRIYLTAGAILTPKLLLNSGIGNNGRRVNNPEVRLFHVFSSFCVFVRARV